MLFAETYYIVFDIFYPTSSIIIILTFFSIKTEINQTIKYHQKFIMWQFSIQRRKIKGWNRSCFPSFIKPIPSRQILVSRTSRGRPPPTSPGHPLKILFDRPGDVPSWRPGDVLKWRPGDVLIWRSRDVPGRLIRDVTRTFSGRNLEDLQSTQTWIPKIFFNFSFRTWLTKSI